MGVHCEINLHKPMDGVFKPGSVVAGSIKYAVDKDAVFKKITVSLKGRGHLLMKQKGSNNQGHRRLRNSEDYVLLQNVIHNDEKGEIALAIGSYETQFHFVLPENIPSTLSVLRHVPRYMITCNIDYFISINFEKPSMFSFDKKFKKGITVLSGITPRLLNVPTICGEEKTLTQLFSSKKSVVNVKATVESCIIQPGGKIKFEYELSNDTNVVIKGVEAKLVEKYTFTSNGGREVVAAEKIKDTDTKTGSVKAGDVQKMPMEIQVPSDRLSLEHSQMVAREYFVEIVVNMPFPHRNAVLNIPLQIGDVDGVTDVSVVAIDDAPPSYWEAMAEDSGMKKDDDAEKEPDEGGFAEEEKKVKK